LAPGSAIARQLSGRALQATSGSPLSISGWERTVSGLDEFGAQLDDLIAAILPPMRATKYVDRDAFDALTGKVNDLIAKSATRLISLAA
jgi:hypothetical protein